jgi:hypothetical protein
MCKEGFPHAQLEFMQEIHDEKRMDIKILS